MAIRKRKISEKKRPAFRQPVVQPDDENDLKKAKERIMKELEESEQNQKEWYDNELDKNLKQQK
jgi:hypothetical protein